MKRILCFGDSNTWGYMPAIGTRYPAAVRWTGILQGELGTGYCVIEDGVNGRTSVFEDCYVGFRCGKKGLGYALCAHNPIDLVILSLGTNDLKFTDAPGACNGIDSLLTFLKAAEQNCNYPTAGGRIFPYGLKALVISPIPLHKDISLRRPDINLSAGYPDSLRFAQLLEPICQRQGAWFLNAADYAGPSEADCIHMDPDCHERLGHAIARKVLEILK